MKKIFLIFILTTFGISSFASLYEEATDALNEGVYSVAVYKLEKYLATKPPEVQARKAKIALAQALLSNGEAVKAISILRDNSLSKDPACQVLLAEALGKTGDLEGALKIYELLESTATGREKEEACLGAATILKALNDPEDALKALHFEFQIPEIHNRAVILAAEIHFSKSDFKSVNTDLKLLKNPSDSESLAAELLAARLAYKDGNAIEYERLYKEVIKKGRHTDPRLAVMALTELANIYADTSHLSAAEDVLEKFIQANPTNTDLLHIFLKLDEIYFKEEDNATPEVRKWALEKDTERGALSQYFAGLLELHQQRPDQAQEYLETFIRDHPSHILIPDAYLRLGRIAMDNGHFLRASEYFKNGLKVARSSHVEAELWFALADAHMGHRSYAEAEKAYLKAANQADFTDAARYNAGIARIKQGLPDSPNAEGNIGASDTLRLMRALELARLRSPAAKTEIETLTHVENKLVSESAIIALAELNFLEKNPDQAKKEIQRIANEGGSDVAKEKADYLSVFLNDENDGAGGHSVREKAEQFLKLYPHSEFALLVRMKLGEACFRQGNYAAAKLSFLEVAGASTDDALSDQALFLAAQCEANSMDADSMAEAMKHFEEVATGGHFFALRARLEQARVKNAMQQPAEAIAILDQLITSHPPQDICFEALIKKGEPIYRMAAKDPANYKKAADIFFLVGNEPGVSSSWRNQALTKAGFALEKTGDKTAALVAFYDVLNAPRGDQPEYFWYYKAGFEAAKLLEADHSWKEAIALYEKMAKAEGPRADEAKQRVNRLRLENLIWEEDQQ
ncbi:MAG: tetratricopeptide repeat protein [Chthoniobacterales bacterium]